MRLNILPLTYRDRKTQISMIDKAVDSAIRIQDEAKRSFVLAGLCVSTDKFIREYQSSRIGGILKMTKVGQMLQEEFSQESRELKKQLEEKENEIRQRDRQHKKEIRQRDRQIKRFKDNQRKTIKNLLDQGNSLEEIIYLTGADIKEIVAIQKTLS